MLGGWVRPLNVFKENDEQPPLRKAKQQGDECVDRTLASHGRRLRCALCGGRRQRKESCKKLDRIRLIWEQRTERRDQFVPTTFRRILRFETERSTHLLQKRVQWRVSMERRTLVAQALGRARLASLDQRLEQPRFTNPRLAAQ